MHKLFIRTAFTALVCGSLTAPAFAQQVSVTLRNGLATVKAENATVRQILEEWARVGQAKVVNAEKLTGPPVTLSLVDVPEGQALDTILRSTAGYMAVDRVTPVANASAYERLLVMSKTTQATMASAATAERISYDPDPDAGQPIPQPVAANEPPAPAAPVVNPYTGTPGAGVGMNAGGAGTVNGNSGGTAAGSTVGVSPAEVKFDYANPLPYFERQRQLQQQQEQQQQQQASQPTATPGVGNGTLLNQPGIAPAPQPTQQTTPQNFNPYNPPPNFNPYNLKPGEAIPGTTPQQQNVTPDRAKYSNPYQPQQTPPQQ